MTPAQKQAVERVREDIACLEQNAGYAARFGTPRSEGRERWNRNFAADLRTLLALLDEQRETLRPFGRAGAVLDAKPRDDAVWAGQRPAPPITFGHLRRAAALTGDQP